MRDIRKKERAEITVLLSFFSLILLVFIMAVLESASVQTAKNLRRADMERALESVFAEYQRKLLEEYDIFALDGTYETGEYAEENILKRLNVYGAVSGETKIEGIRFLSDENGKEFVGQIRQYMENRFGIDAAQDLLGKEEEIHKKEEEIQKYEKEEERINREMEDILDHQTPEGNAGGEGTAQEGQETENPLEILLDLKRKALAEIAIPRNRELSQKSVDGMEGVSRRERQTGKGTLPAQEEIGAAAKIYLLSYISEHFACFADTDADTEKPLAYEMEYLVGNSKEDMENLEIVLDKIRAIRFVPDYLYIRSDSQKQSEAKALAAAVSVLTGNPELTDTIKEGILFAWAYGESIMDVRTLAAGKKVPAVKTKETWQLSLTNLLKLGTKEDTGSGTAGEEGLGYADYLKMLLLLVNQDRLQMRMLDLIEWNMQIRLDCPFFKADACAVRMRIKSRCRLRTGVVYQFSTYYSYQ